MQAKQEAEQKQKEAEARLPRCPRCGGTDLKERQMLVSSENNLYVPYNTCQQCRKTWMKKMLNENSNIIMWVFRYLLFL